MLDLSEPDYKFCPFCDSQLKIKTVDSQKRKYCKNCDWIYYPRVAQATVAIIKKENKILLVKRNREPYKNTWMFPAGFVDYGEHPEETVKREVNEESGLTVNRLRLLEIQQVEDDPREPGHLCFVYLIKSFSGKVKNLDKDENVDIDWFEISNLPKIGWQQHKKLVKQLLKQ